MLNSEGGNNMTIEQEDKWNELAKLRRLENLSQSASAMGKKGGSSKSKAKSTASRANGKLGGRPKKIVE
jgi:hypothetical protein